MRAPAELARPLRLRVQLPAKAAAMTRSEKLALRKLRRHLKRVTRA